MLSKETLKLLFPKEELESLKKQLPKEGIPLWLHWEEFVECYFAFGKSDYTIRNVRDALRFVVRNMKVMIVEEVNTRKFVSHELRNIKELKNHSPVTANSYIKNLNIYLNWLRNEEIIQKNNLFKVMKFKEKRSLMPVSRQEEVEKVEFHLVRRKGSELQRTRNIFLFQLMCYLGARNCEIVKLKCEDFHKNSGKHIIVLDGQKQKGGPRPYTLPDHILKSYLEYMNCRKRLGRDEAFLFVSTTKKGKRLTVNGLRCLFRKIQDETGIYMRPYMLRRYVATTLYGKGLTYEDVGNYLGHTRISTTKRYIEKTSHLTQKGSDIMLGIREKMRSD